MGKRIPCSSASNRTDDPALTVLSQQPRRKEDHPAPPGMTAAALGLARARRAQKQPYRRGGPPAQPTPAPVPAERRIGAATSASERPPSLRPMGRWLSLRGHRPPCQRSSGPARWRPTKKTPWAIAERDQIRQSMHHPLPRTPIPSALAEPPVPGCTRTYHLFRRPVRHSATTELLFTMGQLN
jgi:hypothetical protein